jgi:hypothetical protein
VAEAGEVDAVLQAEVGHVRDRVGVRTVGFPETASADSGQLPHDDTRRPDEAPAPYYRDGASRVDRQEMQENKAFGAGLSHRANKPPD